MNIPQYSTDEELFFTAPDHEVDNNFLSCLLPEQKVQETNFYRLFPRIFPSSQTCQGFQPNAKGLGQKLTGALKKGERGVFQIHLPMEQT
jgi:hypothetical protein